MLPQLACRRADSKRLAAAFALFALVAAALMLFMAGQAHAGQPSRTHVDAYYAGEAVRLEAAILRDTPRPAERPERLRQLALQALRSGDMPAARTLYKNAIAADHESFSAWIGLSDAARRSQGADWRERNELQREARGAAYRALDLAQDDDARAAALARMGGAFALAEDWRRAIDAYRDSLARKEDEYVRQAYSELRTQWGFRVADYSVDANAADPRVCFQFSEPLDHQVRDFAPYVVAGGATDTAVTNGEREICVSGLDHGRSYDFILRAGLPSNIDEPLETAADYTIYIKDRNPSVRFTGRNYVLPRTGQTGIPVVSVNTPQIAIEIFRIGERGLAEAIRGEHFLEQMQGYALERLKEESATPVWAGTMDVETALNEDVTTSVPVLDAVGELQPGVYVMAAQPEGDESEPWSERATQWFIVSDIGLTALSAGDGVHVLARSLETAEPLVGLTLDLVARNNEVLGRVTTDPAGNAHFEAGLSRGTGALAPGIVVARGTGGDFGFLDLTSQAFDLTDRGVAGRTAPGPLDAYLYTERGVYRPGESVFLGALLRNAAGAAITNLPLTIVTSRPDGVEYARAQLDENSAGGRTHQIDLVPDAQSGTWRIRAYVDPKGDAVGEVRFLVENYVPERIALTLTPPAEQPERGGTAAIGVDAQFLYGAPARGLAIGGEITVGPAEPALPGLDGYAYGLDDEPGEPVTTEISTTTVTGGDGTATVDVAVPAAYVSGPLAARITLRVTEAGGRAITRQLSVPLRPEGPVLAVHPQQTANTLSPGSVAGFDVVLANPDGSLADAENVVWELLAVERDWQWYHFDGNWRYEPIERTRRMSSGTLSATAAGPVGLSAPVEWGTHRLVLKSADGAVETAYTFSVGYGGGAPDAPDTMALTLDRDSLEPGETLNVRVAPRFAGKVTVAIVGNGVHDLRTVDAGPDGASVAFTADPAWGTGAYAVAFAHRPLDSAAKRMPGRAIGLKWFAIGRGEKTMKVALGAPAQTRPAQRLDVPVTLAGLAAGERAYITLAAIDVGILNLTRFESPDPVAYVLGQAQLSAEIRDLYGRLIDGMQGTAGKLRSGGDEAPPLLGEAPPEQAPLALFSGIVEADQAGKATVTFDIPPFDGTVRLMAVAWSANRLGAASADVVVRDPVVVSMTAPRFLAIGDNSGVAVSIDNVDGPGGAYELAVAVDGPLAAEGEMTRTLALDAGARLDQVLPVTATGVGTGHVTMTLTGPAGEISRTVAIPVSPASPLVERYVVEDLRPGKTFSLTSDLVSGLIPDTASVSVSASPLATTLRGFDPVGLVRALDVYPWACSEQLVSRALPLLSLDALASGYALGTDTDIGARIDRTIARLLSRQSSSGGFGLWRADDDGLWLNAFVTDFLTRARERGHAVPVQALTAALDRLRNGLVNGIQYDGAEAGLAYAAYVLSRNGRPVGNDVRYVADTRIGDFTDALPRGHIAAALAMFGDGTRAGLAFNAALDSLAEENHDRPRDDYGTRLRDAAAILALLVEGGGEAGAIERARDELARAWQGRTYTSTQEKAWLLAAADGLRREASTWRFSVDGAPVAGPLALNVTAGDLAIHAAEIANTGDKPASLAVTVSGHPREPLPPASNGYRIERTLYRLDGSQVNPNTIHRNERLVVVLRVTEEQAEPAQVLVVDNLPAGFEVENPSLVAGTSLEGLPWLERQFDARHVAFGDTRVVAAFDRQSNQSAYFDVAYLVRAVRPGRYAYPAATVEDMYRPDRYGRTAFSTMTVAE